VPSAPALFLLMNSSTISEDRRSSTKPYWVLAFSLLGISFAGPLVRLSTADPVAIAVWRLGFSLIIVAAFLVATGEWRDWKRITGPELAFAAAGGVALALHFWAWNASIHLTTIAASVTLVNLQPAVVAVISAVALREAPTSRQVVGIAIAILGALVVAAHRRHLLHDRSQLAKVTWSLGVRGHCLLDGVCNAVADSDGTWYHPGAAAIEGDCNFRGAGRGADVARTYGNELGSQVSPRIRRQPDCAG